MSEFHEKIDTVIAKEIMGWVIHPRNTAHWMKATDDSIDYRPMGYTCGSDRFSPSRNISDAWRVVERITTPCIGRVNGMPWSTLFAHIWRNADIWACSADGAAMEICRIALLSAGICLPNPQASAAGVSPSDA